MTDSKRDYLGNLVEVHVLDKWVFTLLEHALACAALAGIPGLWMEVGTEASHSLGGAQAGRVGPLGPRQIFRWRPWTLTHQNIAPPHVSPNTCAGWRARRW